MENKNKKSEHIDSVKFKYLTREELEKDIKCEIDDFLIVKNRGGLYRKLNK